MIFFFFILQENFLLNNKDLTSHLIIQNTISKSTGY